MARHRVMLSRRVIAYYGLIRPSEFLPATYEFAAGPAAPKEIGLRWESRGSPIYSAGLCSRADSLTPVAPKSAHDCCFLFGFSLHLPVKGSATTLVVSRLQSSLRADFALMLRPASWLALLSRTFTFELSLAGSPRTNVEYDYVGKQSIPTTGLSPASPTALWAAKPDLTPRMSAKQHETLLETVLACKGRVMLSAYRSDLYDRLAIGRGMIHSAESGGRRSAKTQDGRSRLVRLLVHIASFHHPPKR